MADLDELKSSSMSKLIGSDSSGQEQTPVQSTLQGGLHVAPTGAKPNGTFTTGQAQGIEAGNTTSTPLGIGATFRGTWFKWQETFSKLAISVNSDVAGTLWIDYSDAASPVNGDDSSVYASTVYAYNPSTNPLFREHVPVQSQWVRVRYQNNGVAQSVFTFNTVLLVNDPGLVALQLRTLPVKDQLAGITRNVPAIPTADGSGFQDLPVASDGSPKSYVTHIQDDVLIEPLSSGQASQTIVGTTPVQLDASALANRRVISVDNEGPVRVALGHSSGITFDTASIRVPVLGSKTFGIDATLPLWAVAENLGGIQNTLTRAGSTAAGTATSPSNALTSDNVYAQMTAAAQTVDISGFTAGTSNSLVSVKLGIEANKASGPNQTVTFQEHQTGSAGNVTSVNTTSNLTAATNHIYIAAISRRNASAAVSSVTGLGLTWGLLASQANGASGIVDVWYAQGTPTMSGLVTANFSAAATNCHIAVTRYSNVNTTTPILNFQVNTGNNSAPTTAALTTATNGYSYMAVFGGNRTMTAGSGYTLESSELINSAGNSDSLSVEDKAIASGGTDTPTGTLSGNTNWAAVSVSLNPAPPVDPIVKLAYTLSGVGGATSQNIAVTSGSDVVTKVDVTSDRTWLVTDIPNVHVIATGITIGGAPINIDQVFLELTDTTGNTARVSVWQGGKAVT